MVSLDLLISLQEKTKVVEKIKIHIYAQNFFPKIVPFKRHVKKNMVQPDRPQMTM
jgi:hypothetical protein